MPNRDFEMSVRFPLGGLYKRHGFQSMPNFTTSDCRNVWSDDVSTGRDRGGRRPGLKKRITTELPDAVRMMAKINLATVDGYVEQLVCSAGGQLYKHRASDDTWQLVSTALRIATDRLVLASPFGQKLIIADWGVTTSGEDTMEVTSGSNVIVFDKLTGATDGAVAVDGLTLTSTAIGDFAAAGVLDDGTHGVRVISGTGATPGWYAIDFVAGTQITLATSPGTSLTGMTFDINVDQEALGVNSDDYRMMIPASTTNGTAGNYEVSDVTDDQITLASSPAAVSTDQISYQMHRAPKIWDLKEDTVELLTATEGIIPLGCNIVITNGNRIYFAGDINFPNLWYASRAGVETDFKYNEPDRARAVSATEFRGGQIGDPITSMIPHNEDCVLFGTNDNFYVLRGDPADGGYLNRISSAVGPVSPLSWCRTERDEVVMLTRDGVYVMPAGCGSLPYQDTGKTLPNALKNIDTDVYTPLMAFDQLQGAVHVYLTYTGTNVSDLIVLDTGIDIAADGITVTSGPPTAATEDWTLKYSGVTYRISRLTGDRVILTEPVPGAPLTGVSGSWNAPFALVYWLDWRRQNEDGAHPVWQHEIAPLAGCDPTAICEFTPFATNKISPVVLGTLEGLTAVYDRNVNDDNGEDFDAYVVIGPMRASYSPSQESLIADIRSVSSLGGDEYEYTVHGALTAEKSMPGYVQLDDTWASETFAASDYSEFLNLAAHAFTIVVQDDADKTAWSFEEFVVRIVPGGLVR